MKELKVSGSIDVEVDGPVMTVVGNGGLVAVSIIDIRGVRVYVYHHGIGWAKQDIGEDESVIDSPTMH